MSYETRPGDTPAIIAKEQLGDRERWREVVEWNLGKCGPMGPHDWYRVWTFLRLPEVEAMSEIDKFRDLPGLVRRLVDDYLSAVKEAEALRQERDGLRDLIIKTMNSYVKEMEGYSYFGSNPGIDDDDIEEIADEIIAAIAKEQGE